MKLTEDQLKAMIGEAVDQSMAPVIVRLETVESRNVPEAIIEPVTPVIQVRENEDPRLKEPGMKFTAFCTTLARARLNHVEPIVQARRDGNPIVIAGYERQEAAIKLAMSDPILQKALAEGILADGGALVDPEFSNDFIPLLRNATCIRVSGARSIPMNSSTLTLGRQTGAASAAYVGENVNATSSQQTTGQLIFSARKLIGLVPVSNDLLRDASPAADQFVRDDLVQVVALKEDATFLRSNGASSQPMGILFEVASGNKQDANSTINVTNVTADLKTVIQDVREANTPMITPGWIFSTRTELFLKTLLDDNNNFVYRAEMDQGTLFSYPYCTSEQVPNNVGTGSDSSEVYFGDFSEAIIAENMNMEIEAFPNGAYHDGSAVVSGISSDQSVIRVTERHDFHLRHNTSFAILEQVDWGK